MDNIFDLAIILGGAYFISAAIQLNVNRVVKAGVVIPPGYDEKRIKDKEGLIAYTYPRLMIEGVILIALGLIGVGLDIVGLSSWHVLIYLIVLIFWIVYTRIVDKGKSKYLLHIEDPKKKEKKLKK